MKNIQNSTGSYEDYLSQCSQYSLKTQSIKLIDLFRLDETLLTNHFPFGTCLIDYSTGQYLYMSANFNDIVTYNAMEYQDGPKFHVSKILQQDKIIFTHCIFPDIINFLKSVPFDEYENYRFSFSYHFCQKNGTISQLLQQSTYLEPVCEGRPLLNLVIISDISDFKTDDCMTLTIGYLDKFTGYVPMFKKHYVTHLNPMVQISTRELEILKLSMDGLSSKMIADNLFLSVHTVKNHKRHMMQKTSSRNISELIKFAVKTRLVY